MSDTVRQTFGIEIGNFVEVFRLQNWISGTRTRLKYRTIGSEVLSSAVPDLEFTRQIIHLLLFKFKILYGVRHNS